MMNHSAHGGDGGGGGTATSNSSDFEDYDECTAAGAGRQPSGRRWDPLGAAKTDDDDDKTMEAEFGGGGGGADTDCRDSAADPGRIKSLEDEQEMLSTSLFALTSHFAQVQFRLRQIVDSPAEQRDQLLHSLEEFAFRGIPDEAVATSGSASSAPVHTTTDAPDHNAAQLNSSLISVDGNSQAKPVSTLSTSSAADVGEHEPIFEAMELQRHRQIELIEQLKRQLTEVERFAYESGSKVAPPQSVLVEKQRVIIDELRDKLNLNVRDDDLPQLSSEQLRSHVDSALGELVGPMKMKDTLVGQLKTQIVDLERFVAHLQCETYDLKQMTRAMGGMRNCEVAYDTYNSQLAKQRRQSRMSTSTTVPTTTLADETDVDADEVFEPSRLTKSAVHSSSAPPSAASTTASSKAPPTTSYADTLTHKAAGVLDKASNILNLFAASQLGAGAAAHFQKNTLKRTTKGNHWGDLRAQLEIDVQEIIALVASVAQQQQQRSRRRRRSSARAVAKRATRRPAVPLQRPSRTTDSSSDDEDTPADGEDVEDEDDDDDDNDDDVFDDADADDDTDAEPPSRVQPLPRYTVEALASVQLEITTMVRKHFAITLQRLVEHGLCENVTASATSLMVVPFIGCFARPRASMNGGASGGGRRSSRGAAGFSAASGYDELALDDSRRQMHAWELCLEYYDIKNGEQFNETPARMLSQSFNLDITDGTAEASSNKQSLLAAIGNIINMHSPYKRSANSHFKALVSMGLNCQKLSQWLQLLFQTRELVQQFYTEWSYVRRTGFRDALKCLERLACYHFDLPVDLAIRQFQNIKDVF